jgi:hypothetical protein
MEKYTVWYMRPEFFRDGIMGFDWLVQKHRLPNIDKLSETHIELLQFETMNLESLFHHMQGEIWSPNGEARELIMSKGLHHTSMSVGDIAVDEHGIVHIVDRFGFQCLNELPDHGDWAMAVED